jgi:hypothetical protein
MTGVRLRIESLMLHGIDVPNAHRIGPAVAAELTRLVRERGLPPGLAADLSSSGHAGSLPPERKQRPGLPGDNAPPAPLRLDAGMSAETVGTRLARAIYDGLAP